VTHRNRNSIETFIRDALSVCLLFTFGGYFDLPSIMCEMYGRRSMIITKKSKYMKREKEIASINCDNCVQ
jgi:hypothetical protein